MKTTNKRLVGILLCLAMVLAMMPMAVFAEAPTTLYLVPNSNWLNDGARFAAYFFGAGEGWVGATDEDGDGVYEVVVPGNDYTHVIFCRMNPNRTDNDWGNKWNQTSDLPIPTDGTNCYTVASGSWDNGNGTWSTYTGGDVIVPEPPVAEPEYYLRGDMNGWAADDANKMVKQDDGTYAITLSLDAGTYEYKAAVADWSWSVPGGDNAVLTLAEAADVTFVLNVEEGTLTNDAPVVEEPPVEYDYYVAGDEELCDVEWDPGFVDNKMVYNEETGLYEIVFDVWYKGTYEYKITTGTWESPSYGYGEGNYSVVVKNPGEITITFNAETTEVTCDVYEFGEGELKFQLNADASADDATVDLRLITSVDTLDYANVEFRVTINGETAFLNCEVVYEAIKANGVTLTCNDIFGEDGYLVTYTITDIPAEYYGADIRVCAVRVGLDGYEVGTNYRTVVLSDLLG